MDERYLRGLQSLRERIRAVCVQDQAQWDATWKAALSDVNISRRGLILPDAFFDVLETNSVLLGRSDARLLMRQFQEPNGAVAVTRFLRWMALNAPADHVNPDLMLPQLPQPYRRIQKVFDHVFDTAWSIITTQSAKFKVESMAAENNNEPHDNRDQIRSHQQNNDYAITRKHSCEPTHQFSLHRSSQHATGLASHCLLPIMVAALNYDPLDDSDSIVAPSLRVISITPEVKALGDFPIEFLVDSQVPAGTTSAEENVHVSIKKLSALQLTKDYSDDYDCSIAVHLEQITTVSEVTDTDTPPEAKLSTSATRECVNVYGISIQSTRDSNDTGMPADCSFQLIATISPTQNHVSSVTLSPDSAYLAVTFVDSSLVALYRLHREKSNQDTEIAVQPLALSSPRIQVDLDASRSPFLEDNCEPTIHFLAVPVSTRAQYGMVVRSGSSVYAFAVCHGLNVLKYLLPTANALSSSTQTSPTILAPAKSWEHLSKITSSALDTTTQYLVAGFEDSTIAIWDVLQDTDYAFCSPFDSKIEYQSPLRTLSGVVGTGITNAIFCHAGYVVALSASQQRLYFFDVRDRSFPLLKRVVSPPSPPHISTTTQQTTSQSAAPAMPMVSLAMVTPNLPVALVEHANGMIVLFDMRTAEAIGSLKPLTAHLTTSFPPASTTQKSKNSDGETIIAGNQDALGIIFRMEFELETHISFYTWRDVLLACFPSILGELQEHGEEPTTTTVMNFYLANSAAGALSAAPPATFTAVDTSVDILAAIFLRMADVAPLSPSQQAPRSKQSNTSGASPLQSPAGRSSLPNIHSELSLPSQLPKDGTRGEQYLEPDTISDLMFEPLVPDADAIFEQYCRQYLEPAEIADKEAKLHRKRRELLKAMSSAAL